MKKICFIASSPMTAKVFLKPIIFKLSENYNIHLACNFEDEILKINGINKIHKLPIGRKISVFKDIVSLIKTYLFLKKNKFDAIHSITPKAGLISMIAGILSKTPIRIHTFTGQVWANKSGISREVLKQIDILISTCSTHILVDGKSQREFLINNKIIDQNTTVLANGSISGVSLKRFEQSETVRKSIRNKLGLKDNDWVFMFLGRITYDKGITDLLNAFTAIKENYNQKLIIVGPDEEGIISSLTKREKNIIYMPFTDKPEEILQACDTFCLPSYREGFGLSVLEASALSKPIICSNIYGLKDTVIENKTGVKHIVKNINSIQEKLIFALENKDLMKEMGLNGGKYVQEKFSQEIVIKEWIKYYQKNI